MKIAFVCNNFKSMNGVERAWSQRLSLLAESGNNVIYLITYNQYGAPLSFPLSKKVHVIDLGTRYITKCSYHGFYQYIDRFKSERVFRKKLQTYLATICPQIVVCSDMHVADLKALLSLKIPVVRVVECHCGRSAYFLDICKYKGLWTKIKQRLIKYQLLRALLKFDRIVVMTEQEKVDWHQDDKVVAIPNMLVQLPHVQHNSLLQYHRVVSVGRYAYQKGYDMLLKAWRIVENRFPEWRLDIYGSNDGGIGELEQLKELVVNLNLRNVSLNMFTTDICSEYLSSDLYVLTSRFESFGLVLIEAMACGLPVISFDCIYGPSSIIKDNTGILVPQNDVQQLANAICKLIDSPDERLRMGIKANLEAERYLPDRIMPLWQEFYKSLERENPISS